MVISAPVMWRTPVPFSAWAISIAPCRPSWSVSASAVWPCSTASPASSWGCEAPSRNEKAEWQWSSAYGIRTHVRMPYGRELRGYGPIQVAAK